jgi:type I restriction enzyme S subunit
LSKTDDLVKSQFVHLIKTHPGQLKLLEELENEGKIILGRGQVISKEEIADNKGDYPVYSSSATNDGIIGLYSKYMFDDERITWSIDGGGKFFYRKPHKYSVTNVCGWLKVVSKNILTEYLYYALSNEWKNKTFDYVHKAHPSVIKKEYNLLIPELSIQRKFIDIAQKSDDAKLKLEKCIQDSISLFKRIIKENFGVKEE